MSAQKKRQADGRGLALQNPENRFGEIRHQDAAPSVRGLLSEFPPEVFKRSASWHLERAHRARSVGELRHHMFAWLIRWACYTRSISCHFVAYAPAAFASAVAASGLRVRFRAADIRAICRIAARAVWGE
ncbi:hypothetical protein [Xanthomonas sp. SHU 199]|uniref:hypothetical protein n=1 Tax=Xanthomonas sp. SHU 199 TaxID=1591174 RepID=UPI0012FEA481|nr:hypothetical protein [Xanthomonas sp. SHU 199]